MTVATVSDIKSAVLNVPGVGWVDVLENTQELRIRCSLVDGLIDAGILQGEKSNLLAMPPTGLCTTDAWKTQPGYRQFSVIGRWVLDPADPANFTSKLRTRKVLIQEVVGDTVVPNQATAIEGLLLGLTPAMADRLATNQPPTPPSVAITTNPMTSKWVRYMTLAPDAPTSFPGNTFGHSTLLSPVNANADGRLATVRMQVDAITYLSANQ
jgi:hypothetical protein